MAPAAGASKTADAQQIKTLTRAQKAALTRQRRKEEQAAADAKVMETILPPRQARATPKRAIYLSLSMCYYPLMTCVLIQHGKRLQHGVGSGNDLNHHPLGQA